MSIVELREFLGWCAVLNVALLVFSSIMIMVMRPTILKLHGKLFKIDEPQLNSILYRWLGNYKIGVILFCIVPYVALSIMAG